MKQDLTEIFWKKTLDRLYRFAMSLTGNREDAQDAVQNVAVKMLQKPERLQGVENKEAFLMTSVRNACLDAKRMAKPHDDKIPDIPSRGNPEAWDEREMIRRAMLRLPDKQREVVHLKDIEGLTTQEIGKLLSIEENQVRTILSRARKTLREILNKEMNHGL